MLIKNENVTLALFIYYEQELKMGSISLWNEFGSCLVIRGGWVCAVQEEWWEYPRDTRVHADPEVTRWDPCTLWERQSVVSRVHGAASEYMWCFGKLSGPWPFPYAVDAGLTLSPTFLGFLGSFDLFLVIFHFFLSIEFARQFILVGFARVGWISVGARENRIGYGYEIRNPT